MNAQEKAVEDYIKEVSKQFATGNATEHSYRPALASLLSTLLPGYVVTNEPKRIECGAPDYIISKRDTNTPIAFVEAKDVNDSDLDGNKGGGIKNSSIAINPPSTTSSSQITWTFIYTNQKNLSTVFGLRKCVAAQYALFRKISRSFCQSLRTWPMHVHRKSHLRKNSRK